MNTYKKNNKRRKTIQERTLEMTFKDVVVFILIAAIVVSIAAIIINRCIELKENYDFSNYNHEIYVVEPGDTLWTISKKYNDNRIDSRQYISMLKECNEDLTATIHPGDKITVLIYKG